MTYYEIPFSYPGNASEVDVYNLIEANNIIIDAQTSWSKLPGEFLLTGTMDDLLNLFLALKRSESIGLLKEYILENNLL